MNRFIQALPTNLQQEVYSLVQKNRIKEKEKQKKKVFNHFVAYNDKKSQLVNFNRNNPNSVRRYLFTYDLPGYVYARADPGSYGTPDDMFADTNDGLSRKNKQNLYNLGKRVYKSLAEYLEVPFERFVFDKDMNSWNKRDVLFYSVGEKVFTGDPSWNADLQNLPKKYKHNVNEITAYINEQSALRGRPYLRPSVSSNNVQRPTQRPNQSPAPSYNALRASGVQRTNQEQRIRNAFSNF